MLSWPTTVEQRHATVSGSGGRKSLAAARNCYELLGSVSFCCGPLGVAAKPLRDAMKPLRDAVNLLRDARNN